MEPECHLCILLWLEAQTILLHYRSSMGENEEEFKKHIQVYKKLDSQFAELHMVCEGIEMSNLAVCRDTQFEVSMRSSVRASILKSPYPLAALSYETSSEAHISLANASISECHDTTSSVYWHRKSMRKDPHVLSRSEHHQSSRTCVFELSRQIICGQNT